jgi:hypothetical protein
MLLFQTLSKIHDDDVKECYSKIRPSYKIVNRLHPVSIAMVIIFILFDSVLVHRKTKLKAFCFKFSGFPMNCLRILQKGSCLFRFAWFYGAPTKFKLHGTDIGKMI